MADPSEISGLLHRIAIGDATAEDELIPLVYVQLRRIAASHLRREGAHSLQPTALVHDAYIRLAQGGGIDCKDRVHFYAIASRVMRRILIDRARARRAGKRGQGALRIDLNHLPEMTDRTYDAVERLNDALSNLEKLDPRQAKIVEMRFFAGLSEEEIGEVLSLSARTVRREWIAAKAWLYGEMVS